MVPPGNEAVSLLFSKLDAGMEKAPQLGKLRGLKAALEVWVFGGGTAAEKILLNCLLGRSCSS